MRNQRTLGHLRFAKIYRPFEAAGIVGTSDANVRRWIYGYSDKRAAMKPVLQKAGMDQFIVSFMDLCELVVVVGFRRAGIKLDTIRRAHAFSKKRFGLEYPFASMELVRHGGHILHEFQQQEGREQGLVLDLDGQYTLPGVVKGKLVDFEFDVVDTLAFRYFPFGHKIPIVVDPRFGSGLPTVKDRNLRTKTLVTRHNAGQDVASIAEDFQLEKSDVEKILLHAA